MSNFTLTFAVKIEADPIQGFAGRTEHSKRDLLNNQVFRTFSGGEEHVVLPKGFLEISDRISEIIIKAKLRNSQDVVRLLLLKNALDKVFPDEPIELSLDYLPYARQDRVCSVGEALSLEVFGALLNTANFRIVSAQDIHNYEEAQKYIKNLRNVGIAESYGLAPVKAAYRGGRFILHESSENLSQWLWGATFAAPDKGAIDRANTLKVFVKENPNTVIYLNKVRCPDTGNIIGMSIRDDFYPSAKVLLVDDICDGGRTFTTAAKYLKSLGVKSVGLFVTHGIFSNGKQYLYDNGIDFIYAINDWTFN